MLHLAATVLITREHEADLEVLMMRRGSGVAFMGGLWVFPGGRMDASDRSPAVRSRLRPQGPAEPVDRLRNIDGTSLDADAAMGLRVAACREAFEEAGVLLAVRAAGEACEADRAARLGPRRAEVTADAGGFVRLLAEEDLYLNPDWLVYWSHWITPSLEPKRFDTRFFIARLPPGQDASADLSELTEHRWINPATVPEAIERGDIKVAPPTLFTLEDLAESFAQHGSLEHMLLAEARRPTPPVMPRIDIQGESINVVMPWDPGYGDVAGEGVEVAAEYPPYLARRRSRLSITRKAGVRT